LPGAGRVPALPLVGRSTRPAPRDDPASAVSRSPVLASLVMGASSSRSAGGVRWGAAEPGRAPAEPLGGAPGGCAGCRKPHRTRRRPSPPTPITVYYAARGKPGSSTVCPPAAGAAPSTPMIARRRPPVVRHPRAGRENLASYRRREPDLRVRPSSGASRWRRRTPSPAGGSCATGTLTRLPDHAARRDALDLLPRLRGSTRGGERSTWPCARSGGRRPVRPSGGAAGTATAVRRLLEASAKRRQIAARAAGPQAVDLSPPAAIRPRRSGADRGRQPYLIEGETGSGKGGCITTVPRPRAVRGHELRGLTATSSRRSSSVTRKGPTPAPSPASRGSSRWRTAG
jgi:hypothetical protein